MPDGASAAVLNVTVVEAQGAGFVTAWPCDEDQHSDTPGLIRPVIPLMLAVDARDPAAFVTKLGELAVGRALAQWARRGVVSWRT